MVWQNPFNPERPFLQVHGCCVYKLTTRSPHTGEITIMDDVEQVRKVVYEMQRKICAAENIYAHRWEEGDLVIFHNRELCIASLVSFRGTRMTMMVKGGCCGKVQ